MMWADCLGDHPSVRPPEAPTQGGPDRADCRAEPRAFCWLPAANGFQVQSTIKRRAGGRTGSDKQTEQTPKATLTNGCGTLCLCDKHPQGTTDRSH
ncbi:hypothetical protein NHX12_000761 [Muraenolepis orangiensis]|uniref:Uncharacterized protein n=1 Tax=Muraenolepis orangiensis TaxID=630683 RepID=A0A9Q0DZL2_9TELE|nr:hypothetical protein NHX12_000761 [Muraenolepis orangiensis]